MGRYISLRLRMAPRRSRLFDAVLLVLILLLPPLWIMAAALMAEKIVLGVPLFLLILHAWSGGCIEMVDIFALPSNEILVISRRAWVFDQRHLIVGHPAGNVHVQSRIHQHQAGR